MKPEQLRQGGTYSSFTLLDITQCPDYSGTGYLFRHARTGFEVYFFSTPDEECFFSYSVFTPPSDNTGVFHIIEHTVLTGSKKYPVRDPFMGMDRNSVNTFLNAMTGPDRTYYPAASPVKKDFDNIFRVYTDAVFDPLLRKESFMQEGIRLTRDGFEGVVFSEMKGDTSNHSSVVFDTANRHLFPSDSPYSFESGGDPLSIVDLSYERFLETYRRCYVPANMTLFLYGDLDILEKLEFLEREYLSKRDGGVRIPRPSSPARWTESSFCRAKSDAEEGDEGATVTVSWLLSPSSEPFSGTLWSLIVNILLSSPGCPLYKAIIESGVGRDISGEGGLNDSFSDFTFSVGITGVDENDAEKAGSVILDALRRICSEGIDPTLIEASLRRMEFNLQEIKEGVPNGYRMFFSRIDRGWAFGRNPSDMLFPRRELASIRKALEADGRFIEHFLERNLLENTHRLLSLVVMDRDNAAESEKEIARKFDIRRKNFDEEEEKRYLEYENTPDSLLSLSLLPRLALSDIPRSSRNIEREEKGRILVSPDVTNGIVYADIAFDCSDLTAQEKEYCSIISRMLTMTNVGEMDYSEFLTRLRFETGAFSALFEAGTACSGTEKDYILIRFKSLDEHYGESLSLVLSLLTQGDFSSPGRIKAVLNDIRSDYESSFIRQAHLFALSAASRTLSASLRTSERTQGLSFWFRVIELMKEKDGRTGKRLKELARRVFSSDRITFHIACGKEKEEDAVRLTENFISMLPHSDVSSSAAVENEDDEGDIAYTFSTPVSYIASAFPVPGPEDRITGALRIFLSIISRSSLWALEREKGGAYSSGASLDINEDIAYFYTYRDPRLDESIDDFSRAAEEEKFTPDCLEDAKLRVLSRDVKPTGPQSRALVDLRRYLYGVTDDLRERMKNAMLDTTLSDLEEAREKCLTLMEKSTTVILTSTSSVSESRRKFRVVKLPFSNKT